MPRCSQNLHSDPSVLTVPVLFTHRCSTLNLSNLLWRSDSMRSQTNSLTLTPSCSARDIITSLVSGERCTAICVIFFVIQPQKIKAPAWWQAPMRQIQCRANNSSQRLVLMTHSEQRRQIRARCLCSNFHRGVCQLMPRSLDSQASCHSGRKIRAFLLWKAFSGN